MGQIDATVLQFQHKKNTLSREGIMDIRKIDSVVCAFFLSWAFPIVFAALGAWGAFHLFQSDVTAVQLWEMLTQKWW
jgi:hypothetical protein